MATAAQIEANRENAAASTGPQSNEGKAKVSQNALKSGLFSKRNCVAPEDAADYEALRAGLWDTFAPQNPAEELFTAEIVRAGWRLQRCALTEESLLALTDSKEIGAIQTSVDRARTQATGVLNRNMEQLRKLQTDRWVRRETLPKEFDASSVGIAASKQVIDAVGSDTQRKLSSNKLNSIEKADRLTAEIFALPEGFLTAGATWESLGTKQSQFDPTSTRPAADPVAQAMAELLKKRTAGAQPEHAAAPEPLRKAA